MGSAEAQRGSEIARSISPLPTKEVQLSITGEKPEWTKGLALRDHRGIIPWDSDQFIGVAAMGDSLTSCVLDSGGGRSMLDVKTCMALGIDYVKAKDSEFGIYRVPGHDFVPYYGVSEPVEIKFNE